MGIDSAVIVSENVREYFHDQVDAALTKQAVKIEDATAVYIVNLLTAFTHARALFEDSDDGRHIKPLAMHYADAVNATGMLEKSAALRKLGDVALFVSGLFKVAPPANQRTNLQTLVIIYFSHDAPLFPRLSPSGLVQ